VARRTPSSVHGVVVVDKPAGMTSHDVVDQLRRRFGERRIGHSGTLDPPATGVLVCAVGRATRLLRFVTDLPKTYTGEIVFGVATTTLDDAGEVTGRWDMGSVDAGAVQAAAAGLTGDILQVPPMVSAVRLGGRRLHELARAGMTVDRQARPVTVHSFDVQPTADPSVWHASVRCGSGTFVRVLASDLGERLGGGAHLRGLRRTAIGSFTEAEAGAVSEAHLLDVAEGVRDLPAVTVDAATAVRVAHGAPLDLSAAPPAAAPCAVFGPDGLLAVYEVAGERMKPVVVLAGAG